MGDVIHCLRVVSSLMTKSSTFELHWVIKQGLEPIIESSGIVSKYFVFIRYGGFLEYMKLAKNLRKENYDYVLDMQGLLRSSVLARLARGAKTFGRADGREFSTLFYSCVGNKFRNDRIHAIERLIPFLDLFDNNGRGDLYLEFPHSRGSKVLAKKLNSEKRKIVIFPESRRPEKVWPYFFELVTQIKEKKDLDIVIAGTEICDKFSGCIDLRGEIKLENLPWLVRGACLVLSNDSAPLHVASALNIPTVALFGPTDAKKYGPYPKTANSLVVSSKTNRISDICVKEVYNAMEKLLTQGDGDS